MINMSDNRLADPSALQGYLPKNVATNLWLENTKLGAGFYLTASVCSIQQFSLSAKSQSQCFTPGITKWWPQTFLSDSLKNIKFRKCIVRVIFHLYIPNSTPQRINTETVLSGVTYIWAIFTEINLSPIIPEYNTETIQVKSAVFGVSFHL